MRDKEWVDTYEWREFQYYQQSHPRQLSDYKHRSAEDLAKDVTVAHDFIKQLIAEKDLIRHKCIVTEQKFARFRKWMYAAFAATWVVVVATLKILVPYAVRGFLATAK